MTDTRILRPWAWNANSFEAGLGRIGIPLWLVVATLAWLGFGCCTVARGADHQEQNAVYSQLLTSGPLPSSSVPLSPPVMADGMSAAEQRQVVERLTERGPPTEIFLRKSTVAPQILRMGEQETVRDGPQVRTAALYFVAYGSLEAVTDEAFLQGLESSSEEQAEGSLLTDEELAARDITRAPGPAEEIFGHTRYELLQRVDLELTGRIALSRTQDSVVVAVLVDPRFAQDRQYPNQWRPLRRDASGKLQRGDPQPYEGLGIYMKATRLKAPEGALFFESQMLFAEPQGWFDGANLLGSKLPLLTQAQVRTMRREILRASQ